MTELQPNLFGKSIQERFEQFHARHPEVMVLFVQFARQARGHGFRAYSAKAIWERMRWELDIQCRDLGVDVKLNNDFTSHYARRAQELYPDLVGFFRTRELRAA